MFLPGDSHLPAGLAVTDDVGMYVAGRKAADPPHRMTIDLAPRVTRRP